MSYEVIVKRVDAVPIAAIPGRARRENMPQIIQGLFNEFYKNPPPATQRGLNIVYYEYTGEETIPLYVGVQLNSPSAASMSTPAGEVAMTTHWGPYSELRKAYDALGAWRKESGRKFAGPFWEVYGHHNDDPAKLQTDVYYLLA